MAKFQFGRKGGGDRRFTDVLVVRHVQFAVGCYLPPAFGQVLVFSCKQVSDADSSHLQGLGFLLCSPAQLGCQLAAVKGEETIDKQIGFTLQCTQTANAGYLVLLGSHQPEISETAVNWGTEGCVHLGIDAEFTDQAKQFALALLGVGYQLDFHSQISLYF